MKLRIFVLVALVLAACVSCSRNPDVVKRKYVQNGNRYFDNGKYKEAYIMYRNALKKDPMYSEAYYRVGLTEIKMGRFIEAVRDLRRAVDSQPDNVDAKVQLADLYLVGYLVNEKERAALGEQIVKIYKDLLQRDAKSVPGLRLKGYMLLLADRKPKEAIEVLEQANRISPLKPEIVLPLAQSLIAADRFAEAEQLGRALIDKQKTYAPIYDLLYGQYVRTNRMAEAEELLKRKAANNPKQAEAYLQLARHYYLTQRRPEMQQTLDRLAGSAEFADGRMKAGGFCFVIRDFDGALRYFQEGSRQDKTRRTDYDKRIAEVLIAQGKRPDAARVLEEVLKQNEKDDEAQAMRAALLIDTGNPQQVQQAIANLQAAVGQSPKNPVMRFNLGRALLAKGEIDQAKLQFQEAVKLRGNYLPPRVALAELQLARRDFSAALQMAREALQIDSNNLRAKLVETTALTGLGNRDQARAELTNAIRQFPNSRDAVLQLGVLDMTERRFKEAEATFSKLYQAAPTDLRALMALSETYIMQEQYDRALQLLQGELKKNPGRNEIRLAIGNTAYKAGKLDVAAEQFRALIQLMPKAAGDLYLRLGHTLRRQRNAEQALSSFEQARQLRPNDAEPVLQAALILDATGQRQKARGYYEQILKMRPDNVVAMNNLAYMMAEDGGDLDGALALAQRAKQKMPENVDIADTLGWIYIKKNLSDNAIQIFRDLVTKRPDNSTFRYHLGMALFQRGDKLQARKELQGALQKKPAREEELKIKELIQKLG